MIKELGIFMTADEHIEFIKQQIAKSPKAVLISSYGLYAGITQFGTVGKYYNPYYDMCNSLIAVPQVKILVGVQNFFSCTDVLCKNCEDFYIGKMRGLLNHHNRWPKFKLRYATDLHFKMFLFAFDDNITGISGGRNMTGSNWDDMSFELSKSQIKASLKLFNNLWARGVDVNDDSICNLIAKQFENHLVL